MLSKGGGSLPLGLPLRAAVELDEVRPEQSAGLRAPIRPRKEAAVNGCLVPPQAAAQTPAFGCPRTNAEAGYSNRN